MAIKATQACCSQRVFFLRHSSGAIPYASGSAVEKSVLVSGAELGEDAEKRPWQKQKPDRKREA